MERYRIVAYTPIGTFYGQLSNNEEHEAEEARESIMNFLNDITERGLNFHFPNQDGNTIIFSKGVIDRTVFEIEEVSD